MIPGEPLASREGTWQQKLVLSASLNEIANCAVLLKEHLSEYNLKKQGNCLNPFSGRSKGWSRC